MLSYILEKPGVLKKVNIPIPEPLQHEVRIRIAYTGICASDAAIYFGLRNPEFFMKKPFYLGHEPSGYIDKVGEKITGLKIGDRVACTNAW